MDDPIVVKTVAGIEIRLMPGGQFEAELPPLVQYEEKRRIRKSSLRSVENAIRRLASSGADAIVCDDISAPRRIPYIRRARIIGRDPRTGRFLEKREGWTRPADVGKYTDRVKVYDEGAFLKMQDLRLRFDGLRREMLEVIHSLPDLTDEHVYGDVGQPGGE